MHVIRDEIEMMNVDHTVRESVLEFFTEVQLEMWLRYLAGGFAWDIQRNFLATVAEFYPSTYRVVDAINRKLEVHLNLQDVQRLSNIEVGSAEKSIRHVLRVVVGALDGWVLWGKTLVWLSITQFGNTAHEKKIMEYC